MNRVMCQTLVMFMRTKAVKCQAKWLAANTLGKLYHISHDLFKELRLKDMWSRYSWFNKLNYNFWNAIQIYRLSQNSSNYPEKSTNSKG